MAKAENPGFLKRSGLFAGTLVGAAWVFLWYVIAIYLVLSTLGVQQFQSRVDEIAARKPELHAEAKILEQKETDLGRRVRDLRHKLDSCNSERDKAEEAATIASADAATASSRLADLMSGKDGASKDTKKIAELQTRISNLAATSAVSGAKRERVWSKCKSLKTQLESSQVDLAKLAAQITFEKRVVVEQIRRNSSQESIIRTVAWFFLDMPREWLTLVLAMAMGIFGSTIALNRTFFGEEGARSIWYFLRPLQGAVMALAIFILLKAGALVFVTATGSQQDIANLNPFSVALIAMLAGLFSEHAYSRLEREAQRRFGGDVPGVHIKPAFAETVDAEMKAQKKTRTQLARLLGAKIEETNRYVAGEVKVPGPVQKVIGAWLNKPTEELFKALE